jgi:hypothetical protein
MSENINKKYFIEYLHEYELKLKLRTIITESNHEQRQ